MGQQLLAFTGGGRPVYAGVDGLSSNSVFLGLGAVYQVNRDINTGIFYRAEFRYEATPSRASP